MNRILIFIIIGLLSVSFINCQSNNTTTIDKSKKEITSIVRGYYFHGTRRCTTCRAVEEVTKEILNEYYATELADKTILFEAINLDEEDSKALANELKVSGQTLLFISDSDTVNLTNQAFMNAVSNPLKFGELITGEIDRMLK
ncbi:MAG: nitrophenyl compound nitroreductase subunit ArsF family protein [Candidatus Marinimicrobia bacterium]|nr:nitrophenyl compound nitroreductase subunit ArsF family protein [Candidatus Neomarinimicrobiota bacterium]